MTTHNAIGTVMIAAGGIAFLAAWWDNKIKLRAAYRAKERADAVYLEAQRAINEEIRAALQPYLAAGQTRSG